MRHVILIVSAVFLTLLMAATAFAGPDWEFSSRHHALAETGNAVFNLKGLSPTLENIACLIGAPEFNILYEGTLNTVNTITSEDDVDYYYRSISAKTGMKTTYATLQRYDEDDFAERLSFAFIPGVYGNSNYKQLNFNKDMEDLGAKDGDEIGETQNYIQTFQRFGVAYGINEYVAVGVGFTLIPPTIIYVTHNGELGFLDPKDQQDDYTTFSPLMFSPELGVLVRPVEFIQLGVAYENGDLKSRRSKVTHTKAESDEDITTEAIVARSPSLGIGFGVLIPDIEKFMVCTDIDVEFRRGHATDYGYYADNQKLQWSVSVEKMWETSSIKGGLGYSDEVGTRKFMPYDAFFFTFGSDLYFDEHTKMGLSFRGETGYLEADPSGLAFGGGLAWTLGGSF